MEAADGRVHDGDEPDRPPFDPEDGAGEDVLDVLSSVGRLVDEDDGRGSRDGVDQADDSLLGDAALAGSGQSEDARGDGG